MTVKQLTRRLVKLEAVHSGSAYDARCELATLCDADLLAILNGAKIGSPVVRQHLREFSTRSDAELLAILSEARGPERSPKRARL
jgi:hypothetical protein